MITNKTKTVQLKMREARFWPKMKFETTFFQILWQFAEVIDDWVAFYKIPNLFNRRPNRRKRRNKITVSNINLNAVFVFSSPSILGLAKYEYFLPRIIIYQPQGKNI